MITIKLPIPSAVQHEINKQNKLKQPKTHNNTLQYDAAPKINPDQPLNQPDINKNNPFDTLAQDDSKPKLKLPFIRKKSFETAEQAYDVTRNEEKANGQEMKRLHEHPYLRKYVDMKSTQKIRRQSSCNFLNIVAVKPTYRSSSRMSSKEANLTANPDRFASFKDKSESKPIVQGEKINVINDVQRRNAKSTKNKTTATIVVAQPSAQKAKHRLSGVSSVTKETLQPIRDKRKSLTLLKTDKIKITPTYYEWCLVLGLIDGVLSQKQGNATYKAFVGKGNNSVLVKNIIKNRPWWSLCQDETDCHLFWNQSRSPRFLEGLKESKISTTMDWETSSKMKLQLIGNCETGLSDRIRNYVGLGFDKILSKSEKERLCRSSLSLQLVYPLNYRTIQANKLKMHNRLQFNWNLSNKKALYYNLKSYYIAMGRNPFENIPETYHVQKEGDDEWNNFLKGYETKGLWIVKPGQNSNRGCGIDVVETLDEVREIVRNKSIRPNGKQRSHIVQRYLLPFLYNKRKFDIRCYMVVTSLNGNLRCYWYEEGYIRTASKQFTTKNLKNRMIHLTNDAVQKYSEAYGKHESGNKLSFNQFQKYLKNNYAEQGYDFFDKVYPRMIQLAADSIRSTHLVIDAKHREFSFQVFGLDFMIDENFNTWLIEVNTNPCLELSCPLLARIIPAMVENALKIALDPVFPPPKEIAKLRSTPEQLFQGNKFSLIFNSRQESYLQTLLKSKKLQNIVESDQQSNCQDEP